MSEQIEIGIKVDNGSAVKSLNDVDKSVKKLGEESGKTAKSVKKLGDAEEKASKSSKKLSSSTKTASDKMGFFGGKIKGVLNQKAPFTGGMMEMGASLGGVATASLGVVAAITGVMFIMKKMTDSLAGYGDEVGKASQRMNVSIEFFQKMESAAGHAGTQMGTMITGMRFLTLQLDQVNNGNKKAINTFKDLNIEVKNSDGSFREQQEVFEDVLIALSKMGDTSKRAIYSQRLLGRTASELAPLFNEGAEAVRNYVKENDSAVIVSEKFATASAKYNDTMQTLTETLKQQVLKATEPLVESMADLVVELSKTGVVSDMANAITLLVEPLTLATRATTGLITAWNWFKNKDQIELKMQFLGVKPKELAKDIREMEEEFKNMKNIQKGYRDPASGVIKYTEAMSAEKIALKEKIAVAKEVYTEQQKQIKITKDLFELQQTKTKTTDSSKIIKQKHDEVVATKKLSVALAEEADNRLESLLWLEDTIKKGAELGEEARANDLEMIEQRKMMWQDFTMNTLAQSFNVVNTIFDAKRASEQRDLVATNNYYNNLLKNDTLSSRKRRKLEQEKQDAINKIQEQQHKKDKKRKIASVWMDFATASMGNWASVMGSLPFPANVIAGGVNDALLLTMAGINTAMIAKYQDGGVIGGYQNTTYGSDNTIISARKGEGVINARQQKYLYDMLNSQQGGSAGVSVNIENFSGRDDDLARLEDMLNELQVAGRI